MIYFRKSSGSLPIFAAIRRAAGSRLPRVYPSVCTTTLMTYRSFPPHPQPAPPVAQLAQHVGPPPAQSSTAQPPRACLGRLRVLWASCKPGRRAPAFSWSKTDKLTSKISSSSKVIALFAVRVSPAVPMAATDAPPASDSVPATPNTVTAFARLLLLRSLLRLRHRGDLPFGWVWPRANQNVANQLRLCPFEKVQFLD